MKYLFAGLLALAALFHWTAPAQAQPCQWNYAMVPGTPDANQGTATATYCGNVVVNGTISGNIAIVGPDNVLFYGARNDGIAVISTSTQITAGTNLLRVPEANFSHTDIGKIIEMSGPGAAGGKFVASIVSVTDNHNIVVSTNASTTVNGTPGHYGLIVYGTDNAVPFAKALASLAPASPPTTAPKVNAPGGEMKCPKGIYVTTAVMRPEANTHFQGEEAGVKQLGGWPTNMVTAGSQLVGSCTIHDAVVNPRHILYDTAGYCLSTVNAQTGSHTAQAGAASTITLNSGASGSNSFYNGATITIVSGTGVGQTRQISGYVGGTKVATVLWAWDTQPDNTSVYTMFGCAPGERWTEQNYTQNTNNVSLVTVSVASGITIKNVSFTSSGDDYEAMRAVGISNCKFDNLFAGGFDIAMERVDELAYCGFTNIVGYTNEYGAIDVGGDHSYDIGVQFLGSDHRITPTAPTWPWAISAANAQNTDPHPHYNTGLWSSSEWMTHTSIQSQGWDRPIFQQGSQGSTFNGAEIEVWDHVGFEAIGGSNTWIGGDAFQFSNNGPAFDGQNTFLSVTGFIWDNTPPPSGQTTFGTFAGSTGGRVTVSNVQPLADDTSPNPAGIIQWDSFWIKNGTWTPRLCGSTSDPTVSYDQQFGYYSRNGNSVTVRGTLFVNSYSGGSGNLQICGLPFTSYNITDNYGVGNFSYIQSLAHAANYNQFLMNLPINSNVIQLWEAGSLQAGNQVPVTAASSGGGTGSTQIIFQATYPIGP